MVRRLGWRHFIWMIFLAGITYGSLPFFYAANYTWNLLHPVCKTREIVGVQGEWIQVRDDEAGILKFWYVPPENGKVIILVGGRGGTLADWQKEVELFVHESYGVAVLADPGCNLETASLGVQEAGQIAVVVNYLHYTENVQWIGAAGFSAGASALAMVVPQTDFLRAIVLMGNFSDLQSEIMYSKYTVGSVGWLGQHAIPFWYWLFTGNRTMDVSPILAYKDYGEVNILLIHGENEASRTQAENQLAALQENGSVNVGLWIVPGADHGLYYEAAGDEYLQLLMGYFDGSNE